MVSVYSTKQRRIELEERFSPSAMQSASVIIAAQIEHMEKGKNGFVDEDVLNEFLFSTYDEILRHMIDYMIEVEKE